MRGEPCSGEFAVVDAAVVAQHVDERDRRRRCVIDGVEQFDELDLTFALAEDPEDPAGAGIEGCEQVECTLANVFVLCQDRVIAWSRGTMARGSRSRLKRRLLVE